MLKIGITGGIGSGKSTVCRIFELLGVPVYYADDAAKRVMTTDQALIDGIKEAFGSEAYTGNVLNRSYIASIVFNDRSKLDRLNNLVHPAVFRDFDHWSALQTARYVVKEAALLFESGSYKLCNRSILVTAPYALKIKRLLQREATTEQEIVKRMARQLSDDEKRRMADYEITNDEKTLLIPQVLRLHQQFLTDTAG